MASTGAARLDALEDDFDDCADELIGLRRRTTAAAARATWGRAWARDIATLTLDDYLDSEHAATATNGDASFTGTWTAAKAFSLWLEDSAAGLGLADPGCALLELGAGAGWLGMTLARNLPDAGRICLTDRTSSGALEWTAANIEHNAARGVPLEAVDTAGLDWATPADVDALATTPWDIAIGSDLIYCAASCPLLATIIVRLLQAGTKRVIYAHTRGRNAGIDEEWAATITAHGLVAHAPPVELDQGGSGAMRTVLWDFGAADNQRGAAM